MFATFAFSAAIMPLLAALAPPEVQPAFPGAQGGGALSRGGRGGRVIEVLNLSPSGPGSFAEAATAKGPRTIIFKVAGTIDLGESWLTIAEPYLTIAGQTAPGPDDATIDSEATGGICIKGQLKIKTHDVTIQYLRIRPGGNLGPNRDKPSSCVMLQQPGHTLMLDHCSLSWSTDENVTIYAIDAPMHSVTVSNCLIAEGLRREQGVSHNQHSAGLIVGSQSAPELVTDISIHHNLFAHTQFRSPYFKGGTGDIISNIVYDWQWWACMIRGGATVDVVGNIFTPGPSFEEADWTTRQGIRLVPWAAMNDRDTARFGSGNMGINAAPSVYLRDNLQARDGNSTALDWQALDTREANLKTPLTPDAAWQRTTRRTPAAHPSALAVVPTDPTTLEATLLPHVGASRRLDANGKWLPARDAIDARIIQQYQARTGSIPSTPPSLRPDESPYPNLAGSPASATPYPDRDHDGLPDAWEAAHHLDPTNPHDSSSIDPTTGFSNLELFLAGEDRSGE